MARSSRREAGTAAGGRAVRNGPREVAWARWSDERLLDLRMRDLGVTLEDCWLVPLIDQVRAELASRELRVRPHFWLSEEWFSPDGVPGVAVPFYLAHPRLVRLERTQVFDVEGGSREEAIKILRHEVGHAVAHAFNLHRRRKWQRVFGLSSEPYPDYYRPNPASRDYVLHLDHWYGQSHPDEDFAETFAVWLRPGGRWKRRYVGWPAMKKLRYVDELMAELAGQRPTVRSRRRVDPIERLDKTLREHYAEKRQRYLVGQPDVLDFDLVRVFGEPEVVGRRGESAASFLRRHRTEIRRLVARWTGEWQFALDQVFKDMIARCTQLKLRAVGSPEALKLDFAVLLAVRTMQCLARKGEWHAL